MIDIIWKGAISIYENESFVTCETVSIYWIECVALSVNLLANVIFIKKGSIGTFNTYISNESPTKSVKCGWIVFA